MAERTVRFTEEFFDRLEEMLPTERGADGEPSVTDFIELEVRPLQQRLAADVIGLTLPTEMPGVRLYVNAGVLVPALMMYMAVDDEEVNVFHVAFGRAT